MWCTSSITLSPKSLITKRRPSSLPFLNSGISDSLGTLNPVSPLISYNALRFHFLSPSLKGNGYFSSFEPCFCHTKICMCRGVQLYTEERQRDREREREMIYRRHSKVRGPLDPSLHLLCLHLVRRSPRHRRPRAATEHGPGDGKASGPVLPFQEARGN